MKTSRVTPAGCPGCGRVLDAATDFAGAAAPAPGDLSVCLWCGAALVFEAGGGLRRLTVEELAALDPGARAALERHLIAVAVRRASRAGRPRG